MPEKMEASNWLTSRLRDRSKPVVMLALGPLTNLARAIQRERSAALNLDRLVIMGGALHVPGNLGDRGAYETKNSRAEWNIFADPLAAQIVFGSGAKIELIPLDATSKVPIDITFLKQFRALARTPLARFVTEVLESDHEAIEGGYFQAWDPLAAVSLTNPGVVTRVPIAVQVGTDGSTAQTDGKPNATVALDANPEEFKRVFRNALQ
jgi:inosine-uridine nucleoside N-ribohydrolase